MPPPKNRDIYNATIEMFGPTNPYFPSEPDIPYHL